MTRHTDKLYVDGLEDLRDNTLENVLRRTEREMRKRLRETTDDIQHAVNRQKVASK